MTVETCYKRAEIARKEGNEEEAKFWEERAARKIAKFPKYSHLREERKDGKKSKG